MAWYHRLLNLTRGKELSRELDREIDFHLAERVDELMATGVPEPEARRQARLSFGHPPVLKERTRDANVLVWLESLGADLRYALRALWLSPAFALVAVLSIGLGVGANTAIFSLINAVLLKPLPVPRADELVRVIRTEQGTVAERGTAALFTNPLWEQIRDGQDAVAAFAYGRTTFNLTTGGEARRVDGNLVSGSYFPVLGIVPRAGRLLTPGDDLRGCPAVAVVSAGFAAAEFGTPEAAVGARVPLDGQSFAIVGVTEPSFFGVEVGSQVQVYVPICAEAILRGTAHNLDGRSTWWLQVMGRPRGPATVAQVSARLATGAPAFHSATLPPDWPADSQTRYLETSLAAEPAATGFSDLRRGYTEALVALMVVVGVVLLIACGNVAHLLLARTAAREREMALRRALGAGRGRLIRQLLTESLLLALLGASVGALFARWAGGLMVRMISNRGSQVWLDLGLDLRVLGFTAAVATLTGVLFGLAPAWRAVRPARGERLQVQGRGDSTRPRRFTATRALVVGQVALSLVLLVASGLLLRTFQNLTTLDTGFDRRGVLLVRVDVENTGTEPAQRLGVYQALLERLRAGPGIEAASAAVITPVSGSGWNGMVEAEGFNPEGRAQGTVWFNEVSEGYFTSFGTRQIAGRDFDARDRAGGQPVAIINAAMAQRVFGDGSPIGRTFRTRRGPRLGPALEVIGVVQDARYRSVRDADVATVYLPLAQAESWGSQMNFALRASGDPAALVPAVRSIIARVHPAISVDFVTLEAQVSASLARPRLLATLSAFFGALALVLATIGLYGTVAYSVARRQNEIGVRMALGARRSGVVGMILGEVGRLLTIGAVLGVLLAVAVTRWLSSFLYGLTATDAITLLLSVVVLCSVAVAAGALPAWRAARLDPMAALRQD